MLYSWMPIRSQTKKRRASRKRKTSRDYLASLPSQNHDECGYDISTDSIGYHISTMEFVNFISLRIKLLMGREYSLKSSIQSFSNIYSDSKLKEELFKKPSLLSTTTTLKKPPTQRRKYLLDEYILLINPIIPTLMICLMNHVLQLDFCFKDFLTMILYYRIFYEGSTPFSESTRVDQDFRVKLYYRERASPFTSMVYCLNLARIR